MKKINKILTLFVFVLVMFLPIFAAGCQETGDPYIVIGRPFLTEYYVGEEINLELGTIEYTNKKGKTSVINATDPAIQISNFSTAAVGNYTLTLTYNGCSVDVDYSVSVLYDAVDTKGAYYLGSVASVLAEKYNETNHYTQGHPLYFDPQNCLDHLTFGQGFVMFQFKDVVNSRMCYDYQGIFYYTKTTVSRKNAYRLINGDTTDCTIVVINADQVRLTGKLEGILGLDMIFTVAS